MTTPAPSAAQMIPAGTSVKDSPYSLFVTWVARGTCDVVAAQGGLMSTLASLGSILLLNRERR
jgi:hypothetical protein